MCAQADPPELCGNENYTSYCPYGARTWRETKSNHTSSRNVRALRDLLSYQCPSLSPTRSKLEFIVSPHNFLCIFNLVDKKRQTKEHLSNFNKKQIDGLRSWPM